MFIYPLIKIIAFPVTSLSLPLSLICRMETSYSNFACLALIRRYTPRIEWNTIHNIRFDGE